MNVYFDNIIFAIQKSGGISVRWKELLAYTHQVGNLLDIRYINYNHSADNIYYADTLKLLPEERIIKRKYFCFTRLIDLEVKERTMFIFFSSYYRVSSNANAINVLTFHDCIQEFYGKGIKNKIAILIKKRVIKKSDYIICNSYTTKHDLIKVYNYPEEKISVIYSGVSPIFFKITNPLTKNKKILFIGSRAPYKRFDFVIELLKFNIELQLTVVGGGTFTPKERLLIAPIQNRIEHLFDIDETKLNEIYNTAYCLMHSSSYEGFGVPIIEAMQSGCPVVAYKCPAAEEIAAGGVLFFNNYDVVEVTSLINKLQDDNFRNALIEQALNISKTFSWEKTGKETINLLQQLSK